MLIFDFDLVREARAGGSRSDGDINRFSNLVDDPRISRRLRDNLVCSHLPSLDSYTHGLRKQDHPRRLFRVIPEVQPCDDLNADVDKDRSNDKSLVQFSVLPGS